MSSQAIGQRIGVSQLAEVLTFYSVAYNVSVLYDVADFYHKS